MYRRDPTLAPFPQVSNVLYGFADSDYAGDTDTHRSTSGYLFLLNGAAVSWKTKRQDVVALSSTEAEFVSLSRAGQHAVSLRALLFELGAILRSFTRTISAASLPELMFRCMVV